MEKTEYDQVIDKKCKMRRNPIANSNFLPRRDYDDKRIEGMVEKIRQERVKRMRGFREIMGMRERKVKSNYRGMQIFMDDRLPR